jgi:hypothetical protein
MRQILMFAAAAALLAGAPAAYAQTFDAKGRCHTSDGRTVKKTACQIMGQGAPAPAGATAICKDGSYSMSRRAAASCASHRGVKALLGK